MTQTEQFALFHLPHFCQNLTFLTIKQHMSARELFFSRIIFPTMEVIISNGYQPMRKYFYLYYKYLWGHSPQLWAVFCFQLRLCCRTDGSAVSCFAYYSVLLFESVGPTIRSSEILSSVYSCNHLLCVVH